MAARQCPADNIACATDTQLIAVPRIDPFHLKLPVTFHVAGRIFGGVQLSLDVSQTNKRLDAAREPPEDKGLSRRRGEDE